MMNGTCKKTPIKSAEILCVGTELLLGDIVNTNAAYLSRALAQLGIPVYHQPLRVVSHHRLMVHGNPKLCECA